MSFGSLRVITINWIWEVMKETISINMKKNMILINLLNGSWVEGGTFPAYILPPQLPLSAISTDLWPRFASRTVDINVLYILSPITYPFDFFGHFILVGLTLCSSSWSSSGSRWHWWTGRAVQWGLRSRERQKRWKPQPLVDVRDGKISGRVVWILTHPSFLFDKLPCLGLKDFKLSLLDTEIFTLLL